MLKGYTIIEDDDVSIQSCARLVMLRYTRSNILMLVAATAWLMLSFSFCIVCGFDFYNVLLTYL